MLPNAPGGGVVVTSGAETQAVLDELSNEIERLNKENAAHRTAILCSLLQTCKNLQITPFVYLRDVIARVSTHPARRVLELTPREWKRLRQKSAAKAAA